VERVLALTRHFGIPAMICVNKWDLNPPIADQIERRAQSGGASIAGRIRYDTAVTGAQIKGTTVVEYGGQVSEDIERMWRNLEEKLNCADVPAVIHV
jgi:MinD superfamily P-loop ATPase